MESHYFFYVHINVTWKTACVYFCIFVVILATSACISIHINLCAYAFVYFMQLCVILPMRACIYIFIYSRIYICFYLCIFVFNVHVQRESLSFFFFFLFFVLSQLYLLLSFFSLLNEPNNPFKSSVTQKLTQSPSPPPCEYQSTHTHTHTEHTLSTHTH